MRALLLLSFASILLLACGGDAGPALVPPPAPAKPPVMTGVSPSRWSRTIPTTMTVTGTDMDQIPAGSSWTFGRCDVASYTGRFTSSASYELVLTPGPKAALGDLCSLTLGLTGQVLPGAFDTGL